MRDREIYQVLASTNFNSTILEEAYSICIDRAEATLNPLLQESAGEGKWRCTFLVCGSCSVIERWCRDGMIESPEEVVDFLMENILYFLNTEGKERV